MWELGNQIKQETQILEELIKKQIEVNLALQETENAIEELLKTDRVYRLFKKEEYEFKEYLKIKNDYKKFLKYVELKNHFRKYCDDF
jgi:hypothetical protein